MDSVLSRLTSRNVGRESALSLENDIVDSGDYCDDQLLCLDDLSLSADDATDGLVEVVETQGGLDNILDTFGQTYGNTEITPEAAQQLSVSVEMYLRSAGVISACNFVPSFESAETYSTELQKAKSNAGGRIVAWLIEALKKAMDIVKRWWGQIGISTKAVGAYTDKIRTKVAAIHGDPKSKEEINLGASANFLTDRNGQIAKPDRQLVESDTRFMDFIHEWGSMFDKETHILKNLPDVKDVKIEFVVGRVIEIVPGTGIGKLTGAKTKITQTKKSASGKGAVLTLSEMEHGLSVAKDALESFMKMEKEINRLDAVSKSAAAESQKAANSYTDSAQGKVFSERAHALVKAFQLCSNGLTQVAPYYLKTIRACVEYVAICTRRYGNSTQEDAK